MEENEVQAPERKRSDGLFWGAILIWAGLVFAADSFGLLPSWGGAEAFTWILAGAGVLALALNLARLLLPDQANPIPWDWLVTAFFLIVGFSGFGFNFDLAWPIALIIIGGSIIVRQLMDRESSL